jgi:hypothetical protein
MVVAMSFLMGRLLGLGVGRDDGCLISRTNEAGRFRHDPAESTGNVVGLSKAPQRRRRDSGLSRSGRVVASARPRHLGGARQIERVGAAQLHKTYETPWDAMEFMLRWRRSPAAPGIGFELIDVPAALWA